MSVANDGAQANGVDVGWSPSITGDGRLVAFPSEASTLVPDDTNNDWDVFVRDGAIGQTTRASIASNGTQGDWGSGWPSISADGRYVAFQSNARNLTGNDANNAPDIFLRDLEAHQTTRISISSDGDQPNGPSFGPSISGDGRYVAFWSTAGNLAPGAMNARGAVFVYDREIGQTSFVSSSFERQNYFAVGPVISANGRYVAFHSYGSDLVIMTRMVRLIFSSMTASRLSSMVLSVLSRSTSERSLQDADTAAGSKSRLDQVSCESIRP